VDSTRAVRSRGRCVCAALVVLGILSGSAAAEDAQPGEPAGEGETAGGIFKAGVGSGFRADTIDLNLSIGAGFGVRAIGGTTKHSLALGSLRLGWIFTGEVLDDSLLAGNWQFLGEIFAGSQIPDTRYLVGFAPHMRYIINTGSLFYPYVDGGMGVAGTDIGEPDLNGKFQFNLQAGMGTYVFLSKDMALDLAYRWFHISNAGISAPNHGLNTEMFYLGLSFFF
jgi:opacity protein-like surface antigen